MAKRKYKKRKKSAAAQHEVPGGFWQQVVGVLMIVVAVALVVTWFGSGGTLLAQIHHGAQSFFGLTAYILPFMLVYLAVQIFTSEENKISPAVFIATVLMIVILSGLTGVMFGDGGGGMLGGAMNRFMLQIMDSGIAVFLYIVLLFITVLFIIQVNPLTALQKSKSMVARPHKNMAEEVEDGGRKLKIRASEGAMAEMEKEKKLMFGFGKKKVAAPVKKAGSCAGEEGSGGAGEEGGDGTDVGLGPRLEDAAARFIREETGARESWQCETKCLYYREYAGGVWD